MRRARYKSTETTFYHLITRVAGYQGEYPLQEEGDGQKLVSLIDLYTAVYVCLPVAMAILGSHYHLIVKMEAFRELTGEELVRRAERLWGRRQAAVRTMTWCREGWQAFNRRLFDLSAMMQHLNGEYGKWYNRQHQRRGHFWAERFRSVELLGLEAVRECLLYVETNPTRAGMVPRPEDWWASSAWRRRQRQDGELMALEELWEGLTKEAAWTEYRERLAERQRSDEAKQATGRSARQRYFTDGIIVGPREAVEKKLQQFREWGYYRRRKNAIPQTGNLYSIREQRSHARPW